MNGPSCYARGIVPPLLCIALGMALPGCHVILGLEDPPSDNVDDAGTLGASDAGVSDAGVSDDAGSPPADWWNAQYAYRTRLTIAAPALQTTLQNVPILLAIDGTDAPYIAGTSENGVRVIAADNTPLDHEIEVWNPAGTSSVWVNLPVLDAGNEQAAWLYYGGPATVSQPQPANVWKNDYIAVWHLHDEVNDNQTGGMHMDSSGNGHGGVQNGNSPLIGDMNAIGGAQEFDGLDDYIAVPAENGLALGYPEMTLLVRAQVRYNGNLDFPHIIAAGGESDVGRYRQLYWIRDKMYVGWAGRYRAGDLSPLVQTGIGAYYTWNVIALVYDGSEARMYLDGEPINMPVSMTGALSPINSFYIGGNPFLDQVTGERRDFDGYIDEVRVSSRARSPDWLRVQQRSLTDSLVTYGQSQCAFSCPP